MASEEVSRKMVLEIKYVNANNAVIHAENLVTGILAKISLGTGIWYPPFTTLPKDSFSRFFKKVQAASSI